MPRATLSSRTWMLRSCLWSTSRLATRESHLKSQINSEPLSFHILSYPFISFHILSYPFISFHILSYPFISFHILSYPFISFHILSYPFISFHILSYPFISFHILSCPFISFHILSCSLITSEPFNFCCIKFFFDSPARTGGERCPTGPQTHIPCPRSYWPIHVPSSD